jgi:lipopolysaccharide transport system ATP-binding protein
VVTAVDALTVEDLSKRYRITKRRATGGAGRLSPFSRQPDTVTAREVWALRDASFVLPEGQILGVIGPNGAGKSTLLKLLARVTPPTSGRAVINGRVVSLLELGAGFQTEFTGRENVYLNAAFFGIERSEVNRRLPDLIDFAELGDAIDRPVKTYSSGMYLRLAFSVAINMDADILLADEVLAVGDLAFQERCLARVQDEAEQGMTVLFVSHDMAAITRLCDRALWLDKGKVADDGNADDIVAAYERSAWANMSTGGGADRHAGAHGRILRGRLLSPAGDELGALRVADDALIETTVQVDTPGVLVRCGVTLQTDALVAFRSVAPVATLVEEPGLLRARVRIPAHLLADTEYTVKLGVVVEHENVYTSMAWENALSFRVYDTDETNSARGDYHGTLQGMVRPLLSWSVDAA